MNIIVCRKKAKHIFYSNLIIFKCRKIQISPDDNVFMLFI